MRSWREVVDELHALIEVTTAAAVPLVAKGRSGSLGEHGPIGERVVARDDVREIRVAFPPDIAKMDAPCGGLVGLVVHLRMRPWAAMSQHGLSLCMCCAAHAYGCTAAGMHMNVFFMTAHSDLGKIVQIIDPTQVLIETRNYNLDRRGATRCDARQQEWNEGVVHD